MYVKMVKTIILVSKVREYDKENINTRRKHGLLFYYRIYTVHMIQYIELIYNAW